MKKKTKKIHRIICEKNKDFRSYKIKVTPLLIEKIRFLRIRNAMRYFERKEDSQNKRHKYHDFAMHFDGCRTIVKNLYRPYRHTTTYLSSITPNFVEDMSIFKEIEQQENRQKNKQNLKRIFSALSELPQKQQRRFLLRYYKGYSIQEIASFENVHRTSIYRSIRVAKARIMNKLKTNDR